MNSIKSNFYINSRFENLFEMVSEDESTFVYY